MNANINKYILHKYSKNTSAYMELYLGWFM